MPADAAMCRIATFSSAEVHELRAAGWVRSDRSTPPVDVTANKFLLDNNATPIFVSAPNITAVHISDDKRTRTYMVQLAVIYQPAGSSAGYSSFAEAVAKLDASTNKSNSENETQPEVSSTESKSAGSRRRGRKRTAGGTTAVLPSNGSTRRKRANVPIVPKLGRATRRRNTAA